MLRDARLVAAKDLRIERSSRILTTQILPFALMVLILFGFGIDPDRRVVEAPDRTVLEQVTPGLFWIAVLFSALLALGRSFALEAADGNLDALRLAGLEPAGVFLGKAAAVLAQLLVLSLFVGCGALLFFGASVQDLWLLLATVFSASLAIATSGTLYAALASGLRVRETLVPLLVVPALAPVLLGASQAAEAALFGPSGDGWPWVAALGSFAVLYLGAGILGFESLLEET